MKWRSIILLLKRKEKKIYERADKLCGFNAFRKHSNHPNENVFSSSDCDYYEPNETNYTDFFEIDLFENTQSSDALVRFPVYVIGAQTHIFCLSANKTDHFFARIYKR